MTPPPANAGTDDLLARERDRLRMVTGALGAGVVIMDAAGAVVSLNAEAERLLGHSGTALMGRDGRCVLFGVDSAEVRRPWAPNADGQMHRQEYSLARTADGRALPIAYTMSSLFLDGRLHEVVLVFQDLTVRDEKARAQSEQREELAQARDLAEAASRAKSDFLASVSHEIRTPLNGILGLTTLVLTEALASEQRLRVETIHRSGESLLALINDVMDAARVETGRLTLICEPVDLMEVIENTVDLFHATAAEKGLGLAFGALRGAPRYVTGDAGRVRQILANLVGNAVKFTERGTVSVRVAAATGGEARILIADTGIGIRPEARGRMFQMFSQEDASITRRFGGSGLGLAISKELAALMNGRIDFDSVTGQGSTFTLSLPLEPTPPGNEPAVWPATLPSGSLLAAAGVQHTALLQLRAFAAASDAELALAPFGGGERTPAMVVLGTSIAELSSADRELLDGRWAPAPRLIFVADVAYADRVNADRVQPGLARNSGDDGHPASLAVPFTVSPSRLAGAVRHLLGAPGEPTRTRTFENALDRKTTRALSVLLVEDNPVNVMVGVGFLKRMGCLVEVADNGRLAIERARTGLFDLILMDVHLPEIDGLAATREIRRQLGERAVRIIGVSAATAPGEIQECLDAGMDGFFSKPLQPTALRDTLDAIACEIDGPTKNAA